MRWLIAAVVSLLTTTFVGLAAAAGWLYWQRVETRGEQSARATLTHYDETTHVVEVGW